MNMLKSELQKKIENIRVNWAISDKKRDENLTVPSGLNNYYDISYGPHGESNLLDIYMPKETKAPLPTIVNIHGGAWVYGCKEIYKFYCMSLALRGFSVVNINYRLAPENAFPAALEDINEALSFIENHGREYFLDKDNLILVGDSAGAQLTSHYAAIFTNADFAGLYDFKLPNVKIKAVGLNCGIYDTLSAIKKSFDEIYLAYLGEDANLSDKDFLNKINVLSHITENFPPAFIMSSYCDFLFSEAEPMHEFLKSKGIESVVHIYGSKDQPEIGHVFHVNCNLPEAKVSNDDECDFFKRFVNQSQVRV